MPTDYPNLLPIGVARDVITAATEGSALMRHATVRRMAAGQERLALRTVNPTAEFVNAYGGRKPLSDVVYEQDSLVAEEVALTVAIPDAFLMDSSFNVDADIQSAFAEAIARALDMAALHGVGAPASFPTGGLIALAGTPVQPAAGESIAAALDAAFGQVEAAGGIPDAVIASSRLRSALRAYSNVEGQPLVDPNDVYGVDLDVTRHWTADPTPDGLVGDFTGVIVGIREDIKVRKSQDAVLQDGTGGIIVNAFQDDSTAYRAYMRVGIAVPGIPTGEAEGDLNYPFAAVETTEAI